MKAVMLVSAVIGILALVGAGVFGIVKLIRYRHETPAAFADVAAPLPIEEARLPGVGLPPPLPVREGSFPVSARAMPPAPKPAGAADLSVRIADVGIVTGGGAGFMHANAVGPEERPAVVFTVMNVGTGVSMRWQFTANLPTLDGRFTSEIQQPLAPGEGRRFTLGFGELLRPGENSLTVSVFPWSGTSDADLSNDAATAILVRSY